MRDQSTENDEAPAGDGPKGANDEHSATARASSHGGVTADTYSAVVLSYETTARKEAFVDMLAAALAVSPSERSSPGSVSGVPRGYVERSRDRWTLYVNEAAMARARALNIVLTITRTIDERDLPVDELELFLGTQAS